MNNKVLSHVSGHVKAQTTAINRAITYWTEQIFWKIFNEAKYLQTSSEQWRYYNMYKSLDKAKYSKVTKNGYRFKIGKS